MGVHGLLNRHRFNDKGECLFEHPGERPLAKRQGQSLAKRLKELEFASDCGKEVRCEA